MGALDILIRLVTTGQQETKRALDDAAKGAADLDKQLEKTGANGGLERVGEHAKAAGSELDAAAEKASALSGKLDTVRNVAAGLALVGAGGLALSGELAKVYKEAEGATQKMDAMLAKRGEGGRLEEMDGWAQKLSKDAALVDDDGIKKASAGLLGFGVNANQIKELMPGLIGQSRLYGLSLESVAEQFGKAFASGNAGTLKRAGVTLSQDDLNYIAKATTEVEQQGRLFERVKKSMDNYALGMTQGMSAAEIASNRAANEIHAAEVAVGKGAAEAQANLAGMTAHIVALVSHNPGLAEGAGEILTYGSAALATIGSVAAFAAQIGSTIIQYQALSLAKRVNAKASEEEAAASVAAGVAAAEGAVGHDVLAASEGAAALAGEGEAASVAIGGAAALAGGAAATGGAVGFGALALSIWAACAPLLVFVAIAGAAALAMVGLDKAMHHGEDKALEQNIEKGNATNQARLDNANKERKKRGQKELTVADWQAMESDDDDSGGSKAGWKSGGEGSGAPGAGAPDMASLQAMLANSKPGAAPQLGPAAAMPSAPAAPTATASSSTQSDGGAAPEGETKYGAKQREQAEKRAVHEATKEAHDATREQKVEERARERAQKLAEHDAKAEAHDEMAVEKAARHAQSSEKVAALREELAVARHMHDAARVRVLTAQIEHERTGTKYADSMSAAALSKGSHRAALEAIAASDLEADDAKGAHSGENSSMSGGSGGGGRSGAGAGGRARSGTGENGALMEYLRSGGDLDDWERAKKARKIGGKAAAFSGSEGESGGGEGGTLGVRVPMPGIRQGRGSSGKIRLEFIAPAPMEIDNPLARHLEEF